MIHELLGTGKGKATTGRALAALLDMDIRKVTKQIERERRAGHPICASNDEDNPGYYLAEDDRDLNKYCDQLKSRAVELFKTRQALLKTLQAVADKKVQEESRQLPGE